jgi:predicted DNA-binding transcriptional regulator AlpA
MQSEHRYFDTKSIAALTNTSVSFWNQRRVRGDGPPYVKLGSKVLYVLDDVEAWLKSRSRHSTSEVA